MTFAWMDKQILVTGAGGFIGSHLVETLVEHGARVRAFVRYNARNDPGLLRLLPPGALVAAVLLEIGKRTMGVYLENALAIIFSTASAKMRIWAHRIITRSRLGPSVDSPGAPHSGTVR